MATPKKSTRATRTKTETAIEFEEVQAATASRRQLSPGEAAVVAAKEQATRGALSKFSLESTLQGLTTTGLALTKSLSAISEDLQNAAKQVEELTEAKALLEKDIEALHGKEVASSAIEDLVADYKAKEEEIRLGLSTLQADISRQRAEVQQAWTREQQEHQRLVAQRDADLNTARQRENEQYSYKVSQERQRAEQEFANRLADQKRANELKQAELSRNWEQREADLKAQEDEVAKLKARVDGIQTEIDAAVKKEVAIVTNALTRDHKHQVELSTRDFAAKETVLNAKVENLTTQLASANKAIADLTVQLAAANEKVAKIAGEALTAASGRQALSEVQSLLQTQANGPAKKA